MADRPEDGDAERTDDLGGEPSVLGAAQPLTVERADKKKREGGWRPKTPKAGIWVVVVVLVLILLAVSPIFFAGLKKTPRDRVGISYGAGPIEGAHFQRIVQPGSGLFFNGLFDQLYLYPSDQVNYIISQVKGVGASKNPDAVVAPTADRVQVTYQVAVYFKLNTDLLRAFHEELGLRYQGYTTTGWNRLIQDTFRQQIENALQEETRRVDVADLYGSADFLVELQDRVQTKLTQRLSEATGSRFFCAPTFRPGGECGDPTFIIKKVDIPATVVKAFADNKISQIKITTRTNEIAQREAEAKAKAALGLTGQEYNTLKAIESGKITFWVLPNDAGVTLTTPSTGGGSGTTSTTRPSGG